MGFPEPLYFTEMLSPLKYCFKVFPWDIKGFYMVPNVPPLSSNTSPHKNSLMSRPCCGKPEPICVVFQCEKARRWQALTWCLKHSLRPSSKQSSLDCVWDTWQPHSGTGSTAQKENVGRSFLGSSLDVQFREESWAAQELNKQWLGRGCSKKFKAKSLVGN